MSSTSNTEMLNQSDINHQETSITKFEKYSKLVPLLRNHTLTYLNKNTLREYSQCSKECNKEVQQFNTIRPYEINLHDIDNGIKVEFVYRFPNRFYTFDKSVRKEFKYAEEKHTMQEIEDHFIKYHKFVKTGSTYRISLKMKTWPVRLMNLPMIKNIIQWDVAFHPTMIDGFMEFFRTREELVKCLDIDWFPGVDDQSVTIPSEFFKFSFWKKVEYARIVVPCSFKDIDFVNVNVALETLELCHFVSIDDIRQKVADVNADPTMEMRTVQIILALDSPHRYNITEVFPGQEILESGGAYSFDYCIIGRVFACVNNHGRVLRLTNDFDLLDY